MERDIVDDLYTPDYEPDDECEDDDLLLWRGELAGPGEVCDASDEASEGGDDNAGWRTEPLRR